MTGLVYKGWKIVIKNRKKNWKGLRVGAEIDGDLVKRGWKTGVGSRKLMILYKHSNNLREAWS
jgi:hypothetical protein